MEFFLQIRIVYRHILFLYIFLYRKKEMCAGCSLMCVPPLRTGPIESTAVYMMFRVSVALHLHLCEKKKVVQVLLSPPVGRGGERNLFVSESRR